MQAIYTVCADDEEAMTIGEALVTEGLAACTNRWSIDSVYRHDGEVRHGEETAMIVKTKVANVQDVFQKIKELHSYDTPAIFVLPTGVVEENYLDWVQGTC